MGDREQREDAYFIGRFNEIADTLALRCHDPAVNDGYRLMFALRDELARSSGRRVVSAISVSREQDCPQPFGLYRHQDVTGVSGSGTVAYGVQFADGTVVIRWLGENPSTVVWASLDAAMRVHGHDGRTRVVWLAAPFSEMGLAEQEAAAAERGRIITLLQAQADREQQASDAFPSDPGLTGAARAARVMVLIARGETGGEGMMP